VLPDAKTPNSPDWWLLRLGARLGGDIPRMDRLDDYWRGNHPLPFGNMKMREAYRKFQKQSKTNFCKLVAESVVERLKVTGFRTGGDGSETLDKQAWGWWQSNHLDADSGLVHRAAIVMSRAYVIVGEDPDHPGQPLVTGEDPRQVIHESSPTNRRKRLAALKTWWDDINSRQQAVLYLPDSIHYYRGRTQKQPPTNMWTQAAWEPDVSDDYPDGYAVNTLGEVPVVPFMCCPDLGGNTLGEFEDVLPVQDRINTEVLDRMVISTMQAYRQRWATGVDLTDENGNPAGGFDPGADLLWNVADDAAKFGEFQPADLTSVLKAVEADVQHLAAITRTPPHYLLGSIINAPLALDTVIPTPDGRTTMGDVSIGDAVFDETGTVQKVTAISPIFVDRDCYRVVFSDGTSVVADGAHLWTTTHFSDPQRPYWRPTRGTGYTGKQLRGAFRETSTVTTEQIAASLRTSMGTNNHFIEVAGPPDGPEREYLIHPYVLGVWLGDGDRVNGLITSHVDDAAEMATHLRDCGERVDVRPYTDHEHRNCMHICIRHDPDLCPYGHDRGQPKGTHTISRHCMECDRVRQLDKYHGRPSQLPARSNRSFVARLKLAGLWKNKHIPEEYFHGSFKQRLALLQGLMDTDGTVKRGQGGMELGFHDERLSTDAARLIQSLGHKVMLRKGRFTSKSKGIAGDRWRLVWSARDPVFRLARKAALQNTEFSSSGQQKVFQRFIVSCDPVDSVPVRCITVTGPSHLFCVTDAFIATHNSGDALAAAETGLTSKVTERSAEFGESWETVYQLAGMVQGKTVPDDCEVIWQDPQFRTLMEMAAANVQLVTAGVPWRTRMSLLPFTPSQIDRMQSERASDAMLNSILSPPAAPFNAPKPAGAPGGAAVPAQAVARAMGLPAGSAAAERVRPSGPAISSQP